MQTYREGKYQVRYKSKPYTAYVSKFNNRIYLIVDSKQLGRVAEVRLLDYPTRDKITYYISQNVA